MALTLVKKVSAAATGLSIGLNLGPSKLVMYNRHMNMVNVISDRITHRT